MPFDTTDYGSGHDPAPMRRSWWWADGKNAALAVAAVWATYMLGLLASFTVDGFPPPNLVPPAQFGSTLGMIVEGGVWVISIAGFVWWRVRRGTAGRSNP